MHTRTVAFSKDHQLGIRGIETKRLIRNDNPVDPSVSTIGETPSSAI